MKKKCQTKNFEKENHIIPMETETKEIMKQINKEQNDEKMDDIKADKTLNISFATNYSSNNQSLSSLNNSKSSNNDQFSNKFDCAKGNSEYLYNTEYLKEIYMNLILEENNSKMKIQKGYMNAQTDINDSMRAILNDWLIDVHYNFGLKQKTLFQTINIIDLYLSKQVIERSKFQLLGVASLLISCKENEISLPHIHDFVQVTDKAYSKEDILKMEKQVLQVLNFDVLSPTSEEFFNIISKIFSFNTIQQHMGEFFLESALIDYGMINYEYSIIASACAYIVMKYFNLSGYNNLYSSKITFNNSPQKNIKKCAKKLCFLVRSLSKSKLRAAKNKYSLEKFGKVANFFEK